MRLFELKEDVKKYIALQGNEYGLSFEPGEEIKFVTFKEAEQQYKKFFDENGYGAGAIIEVSENSLNIIKSECNL